MDTGNLADTLSKHYTFDESKGLNILRRGIDNDVYIFFLKDRNKAIARVSKRKSAPSLKFEIDLVNTLTKNNVEVAPIIQTEGKKDFVKLSDGNVIVCFKFIDGKPIQVEDNLTPSLSIISQSATALGKFHTATSNLNLDHSGRRTIYSELERGLNLKKEITDMFEDGQEFVNDLEKGLQTARSRKAEWGIIHNDYNPSNILFDNSKLKAIVDFDWACQGPLLIDVGYGAVTWSTKEKSTEPNKKAFETFIESYREHSHIKNFYNEDLSFWTAYSCLYLAANFICDSTINNRYCITRTNQSWMYERFKFYISS